MCFYVQIMSRRYFSWVEVFRICRLTNAESDQVCCMFMNPISSGYSYIYQIFEISTLLFASKGVTKYKSYDIKKDTQEKKIFPRLSPPGT